MTADVRHTPVMTERVLAYMAPRDGGIYVDGTFGGGGHSRALLDAAACRVYAIDRDPAARERCAALLREYYDRLVLINGRFGDMEHLLAEAGITAVDGVVLDLGLSSDQLADAERGFSFRLDGPLDMRMGREAAGPTAADLVNETPERTLAWIIASLGEERRARAVARAIVEARDVAPITRTTQLAQIVRRVAGRSNASIDPATKTFQALRMRVNDELGEIDRGLAAAERLLRSGGRAVVISFHSLEDRRVKRFFRARSGGAARPSRHQPDAALTGATKSPDPTFTVLTRKAEKPPAAEIAGNPRARSSRLRAAERTAAPAWPEGQAA